jgi:hypothetical protein
MQLIQAAAGQPLVSGQLAHMPAAVRVDSVASFAPGGSLTINHFASTAQFLAQLPGGVRPTGQATREATPKTAADFASSLWHWLENATVIRTPPALFDAWQRYVRQAVQFATDNGVASARAYHSDCMEAAEKGWWHPLAHGPTYGVALTQHIASATKPAGRTWARGAKSAKRKAPDATQQPPASREPGGCSVHPNATHTNAQCYQQHGDRRQRPPRGG